MSPDPKIEVLCGISTENDNLIRQSFNRVFMRTSSFNQHISRREKETAGGWFRVVLTVIIPERMNNAL